MTRYAITSGGYLHGPTEDPDIEVDLRPYRDPHAAATLRYLTAHDAEVQDAVRRTPGISDLVDQTVERAILLGRLVDQVTIASFCAGGRHRGPVAAEMIAERLPGGSVDLFHRDLDKPVVERPIH